MATAEYSVGVDIATKNAEQQIQRLQNQINGLGNSRVGQNIGNSISNGVNTASQSLSRLETQLKNLNIGPGVTASLRSAQNQIGQLEQSLSRLGTNGANNIGQSIARSVNSGVASAEQSIRRLNQEVGGVGSTLNKAAAGGAGLAAFPATFSKIRNAVLATTAVLGGAGLAGALVNTTAKFQDFRSALNSVYGSVEAGSAAFKTIQDFAVATPFDVEQLTKAFITLKAQGLNPTKELLMTFSDAASVTTDRVRTFDALVRITSRSLSGGLGLEELNQVAEAGLPVFDILQKKLGITRLEISKFGQDADGAQKILVALQQGLAERFGGATEQNANNLSVSLSNLGDAARNAMDVIGKNGLGQAINEVAQSITNWINNNQEAAASIGQGLGTAVRIVGGLVVVLADNFKLIGSVLAGIGIVKYGGMFLSFAGSILTVVRNLGLLGSAVKGVSAAIALAGGPVTLLLTGLSALAVYAYNTSDSFKAFADTIGRYVVNGILNAITAVGKLGSTLGVIGSSLGSFLSGNTSAFNGLGDRISKVWTGFRSLNQTIFQGSQASKQDAAAKNAQAQAAARAKAVQDGFNQSFAQSLSQFNNGQSPVSKMTDAQKKHADSVKDFTDKLKEQISTLQIDIQTMGQSNTAHDAAIRLRDAEKLGIVGQTAALRDKVTALQQEKAEKQFAGNFQDYIANLNAETAALSLNRKEREIALEILRQENAAKAAGTTLTAAQKQQLEAAIRANQAAKTAADARDKAEDESQQKAIENQKKLQDEINNTNGSYANLGKYGSTSGTANSSSTKSIGEAIVDAIFGKSSSSKSAAGAGTPVQYNAKTGTYSDQTYGSRILQSMGLFNYSNRNSTLNGSSTSVSGSTLSYGNNSQAYNGGVSSVSTGGITINVNNTGNPIDQNTIVQLTTAISQQVKAQIINELRPNGLLYGASM